MNVLIIAAHPDDEVLGCGGTIARLAREGHDVYIAILGQGVMSRYDDASEEAGSLIRALAETSRKVAKLLRAKEVFTYDLPDNQFDTVPLLKIVKIIEDLIVKLQPEAVYTHHGGDLNVDHNLVHRATLTAARPIPGTMVKTVYAYEVASSTEWAFAGIDTAFRPNVFMDIADTLETKLKAISLYESESRTFPHPRSPEALRAGAQRWGCVVGREAVEAFELIRDVR